MVVEYRREGLATFFLPRLEWTGELLQQGLGATALANSCVLAST